jgi:GH15 family glucan-1,4-alpha-glucosidase
MTDTGTPPTDMDRTELTMYGLSMDPALPLPGRSPFPPIADYGFLSDCEVNALVASSGSVEWMCLPRLDSPSIFAAILDRHAGSFRLGPAEVSVPVSRRYLPGTMVLETSWGTASGWIIVRDVLLIGPWRHEGELSHTHRRPPTDYDAEHVLLRTVRCVNGEVQLVLDCEPIYDYGRTHATWSYPGSSYHDGIARFAGSDLELRVTTDLRLGFEGGRAMARTLLKEGDTRFCALSWTAHEPPHSYDDAYRRLVWTAHHWQHWLARGTFPDHPWRQDLQRSALTLKGLTYAPTGAIIAAATTSLPETPGGERNWDYRYTWIRDTAFMLRALHGLGFDWEAFEYFAFILDVVSRQGLDHPSLQIMYGIGGETDLTESTLDHLSGYGGARPVRIGNGAYDQQQHDVWGMLLDSVAVHQRNGGQIPKPVWDGIAALVDTAIARCPEPDQGIWEMRGEPQHFVASKVMCWVAADRGVRLARVRDDKDRADRWQKAAYEIHAEVCAKGVSDRGVFRQHYDTDDLDASLLLIPIMGFLPPDDERVRATVLAIADELTQDDLVLRYRVALTDDGLSGEEGTFTICSFWLVAALALIGETDRARKLFEKLLSFAGPLHLYAEEIDTTTGQHLGNFPQAFTHLALIDAATRLIEVETDP